MLRELLDKLRPGQSTVVTVTSMEVKNEIEKEVRSRGWVAHFVERREMHTTLDGRGWHLQAAKELEPAQAEIMRTQ